MQVVIHEMKVVPLSMSELMKDRLREAIDKSSYTQAQLAQKLNTTQSAISAWRRGLAIPKNLAFVASVLSVSVEWLRGETDDPTPVMLSSDLDPFQRKAAAWIEQNRNRTDPEFVATLLLMGYTIDEIRNLASGDIPKQLSKGEDESGIPNED